MKLVKYSPTFSNQQRSAYKRRKLRGRNGIVVEEKDKGWIVVLFLDNMEFKTLRNSEVEEVKLPKTGEENDGCD